MTKGRLQISKVNLMGYTAETQMYLVQSTMCNKEIKNGTVNTYEFLKFVSKWLSRTSDGYVIVATRLAKFKAYCEAKGFEVIDA